MRRHCRLPLLPVVFAMMMLMLIISLSPHYCQRHAIAIDYATLLIAYAAMPLLRHRVTHATLLPLLFADA